MAFNLSPKENSGEEPGHMAEINIVPLVDVMLVLLIIFMVAAPLSISGVHVNLPASKAKGKAPSENQVILSINSEGRFYVGKRELKEIDLQTELGTIFRNKKEKSLFIRADRDVSYGRVVDAMSAAKIAGIHKISMLTRPPLMGNAKNSAESRKKL